MNIIDKEISVEDALNELYNNSSNENRLYLYWKGDTCDSVTGGWESSYTVNRWSSSYDPSTLSKKDASFNTDYIDISTNSTFQYCSANTKNKINFSGYNYLYICYSMANTYNTRIILTDDLTSGNYAASADGASEKYRRTIGVNTGIQLLAIPIDSTAEGYFVVSALRGVNTDKTTDLKVYGIYLSTGDVDYR